MCSAVARGILLTPYLLHESMESLLLFLSDLLFCTQSLKLTDLSHRLIAEILCRVHLHTTLVVDRLISYHVSDFLNALDCVHTITL